MSQLSVFLIAIGLAMDAFVVSVSIGVVLKEYKFKYALKLGLYFGFFQFIMTFFGYLLSKIFNGNLIPYNIYIASLVLFFVGFNMIYQAYKSYESNNKFVSHLQILNFKNLIVFSLATSMDAMAVGVSLSLLNNNINILYVSLFIGITASILSVLAVKVGKYIGAIAKNKAEYLGGIIIIFIAIKVLMHNS